MILELSMDCQGLKVYKVSINDDHPGLTYLVEIDYCTDTRPRYQVSVYKTNGPLVYFPSYCTPGCYH